MGTIKVTVSNSYLHNIVDEFICTNVDMSDLNEVDYCAEECVGQYLEAHEDVIHAKCPDINFETIAEKCYYFVEEVIDNDSEL